jgi:hypothetical protein
VSVLARTQEMVFGAADRFRDRCDEAGYISEDVNNISEEVNKKRRRDRKHKNIQAEQEAEKHCKNNSASQS